GLARYAQTSEGLPHGQWWNPLAGMIAVVVALLATAVFWGLRTFNNLVIYRTRAQQSWSQIDVHLKQRYDLIPNLVEVVRSYLTHEKGLLESVTAARSQALSGGMAVKVGVEEQAVAGLTKLVARAESYPDLKANPLFRKLADQITALENKIAHARGYFDDSVAAYNTQVRVFPANLIAGLCKFEEYPLFAAELSEKTAPKVSENN